MRIDAHQHFWDYNSERYGWIEDKAIQKDFAPEDLKPLLDLHGFDGCIAVQADQSEEETRFLLNLAAEHNFIKGVVGWLDLSAENIEEKLAQYAKNKSFKGLRYTVYDEWGEFMVDRRFQNGISKLSKFGLVYEILVFPYQLKGAIELVNRFPEQRFVLNHMGKPEIFENASEDWKEGIRSLAQNKNVYCKISGLLSAAGKREWGLQDFYPFLDFVFENFSEDKIIFGSDWPVSLSGGSYAQAVDVIENYLSAQDENLLRKVFGENAKKFYRL
ncbi:amidohydrolase family protein [Zunongwangia sp. F363]|uniref:Amidohydrolase family protein n=1 Tax=Autumnicola tepida TaxID=3075595 RepID=A0ABU3CF23_9FLAO|nr:amidohydrolase family protein [Zunongwangia sp. F363]MDT0644848.1 amidohydrolase family protein [Zunongwangia sp. F363]